MPVAPPDILRNVGNGYDECVDRILVAEDDDGIREILTRVLLRSGYDVTATGDGPHAAKAGVEGSYDLLLLDVGLPHLDGWEVCRRVRAVHRSLPILFLTARTSEQDFRHGFDAGATVYMTKPFGVGQLLTVVRTELHAARCRAGARL